MPYLIRGDYRYKYCTLYFGSLKKGGTINSRKRIEPATLLYLKKIDHWELILLAEPHIDKYILLVNKIHKSIIYSP